jgi:2-oxoglutarate dehydrogenase E2 component (dihydrolipoamide succinyltransferase)
VAFIIRLEAAVRAPKKTAPAAPLRKEGLMPTDVVMPQMGESIFEGTITKWLKQPGDIVEKDEPLFEISTDKVDAEIPSPVAGVLAEIRALEGTTVQINTVVAVIGDGAVEKATPEATAAGKPIETAAPDGIDTVPEPQAAEEFAPAQAPASIRSSPLVRKIAKEHGVNLAQMRGTGSAGRITKDDILLHLSHKGQSKGSAPPQVAQVPQKAQPGDSLPAVSPLIGTVQPLSKMRAIIAQRMKQSVDTAPHAHMVYKIDMTRIARLRERERANFEQRHGVKLTYMPFIAAAAVEALRKFPIVNSSLIDGQIHYHANIHLGIAVALEWGLIVPVVREAEKRSFVDLVKTINDLAARARTKKLNPDEASGSTFTLTNAGVFGGEYGTPIINQPESAILAIGGLRKEPVVLTDDDSNDTIAIRSMQYYCLGFDHRTIDGADAGRFMVEFQNALENWDKEIC